MAGWLGRCPRAGELKEEARQSLVREGERQEASWIFHVCPCLQNLKGNILVLVAFRSAKSSFMCFSSEPKSD